MPDSRTPPRELARDVAALQQGAHRRWADDLVLGPDATRQSLGSLADAARLALASDGGRQSHDSRAAAGLLGLADHLGPVTVQSAHTADTAVDAHDRLVEVDVFPAEREGLPHPQERAEQEQTEREPWVAPPP
jgi:hypothetical protein